MKVWRERGGSVCGSPFTLPFTLTRDSAASAFSLVEVTLALGIAAFCLIVMLGLLPAGINASRSGMEQTAATGFAAAVAADLRSSGTPGPRFGFGDTTVLQTRFLAEDGTVSPSLVSSGNSPSRYRVTVQRGASSRPSAVQVRIFVSWPAAADPVATQWPVKFSGSVDMVTALNPG